MKNPKSCYILFLLVAVTACSPFGKLYKDPERVTLALPAKPQAPAPVAKPDSVSPPPVLNFILVSATGDSIPVGMSVEWDSVHNESMTTMALHEVVISASSIRNTAERNGLINVEFVVTVPKALQKDNWMVNVRPVLMRGDVPDSLKELRFTGQRFREMQERDYRRYDRFLEKIIPDSVNFYRTYVNYRSFERYLERLKWYKRGLERRRAIQEAKKNRPDLLLARFADFNRRAMCNDSLLKVNMTDNAQHMIERQKWEYNLALARANDTVWLQWPELTDRFRYFNAVWADRVKYQGKELVKRRGDFYLRAAQAPFFHASRNYFGKGGVDSRFYKPRFDYFNRKMKMLDASLKRHYQDKGERNASDRGVKTLRAMLIGRRIPSETQKNTPADTAKHNRRYQMWRDLFPMYHFRRPDINTTPPAWLKAQSMDTVNTWRKRQAEFSEEGILIYYGLQGRKPGYTRSRLPLYNYRRNLTDSLRVSDKAPVDIVYTRFDSTGILKRYNARYELLRNLYPQYHVQRELFNIHPPAVRHAAREAMYTEWLSRINSLDSTDLMKKFYNTQKIARNEARKASKGERYHDIVRFPFNPEAQLDTVIYAADQVRFLYSQKVPADENSARMKVFVVGDVLDKKGNSFVLPKSDTLTYLVSSMTKFIDKTPRFVRQIVTRDAEANTSVDFYFPRNRFDLDENIDINRKGVKKVKDLTLTLMTDPVYRIDSLTLFATASPEGSWRINGEMAQKRAKSIHDVLAKDFRHLYDSLSVGLTLKIDESGKVTRQDAKSDIPDLPNLIKVRTIPEDWNKLCRLILKDEDFAGDKDAVLDIIDREHDPDRREWLIKSRHKKEYAYMFDKLYPMMRAVDFRFSLSRRGMKQDTIYSNVPDTAYARGVEYLEKRKYEKALDILRPYEDVNTAIAYMSLGYDKAALRIFKQCPQNAETLYMQAILNARLGDEKEAIILLVRSAGMNRMMRSRANLDPELSLLVKKYNLFKEDEDDYNY